MSNIAEFKHRDEMLRIRCHTANEGRAESRGFINHIHQSVERVNADLVPGCFPPPLEPREETTRNARCSGTTFANQGFEVHRL